MTRKLEFLILGIILFVTFILRFPSLYEPFWYGDEGIFAAVASNLNQGGILYKTAWDNKPPAIYLTYAAVFKTFGVSMFWLRLITIIFVLSTAAALYEIAKKVYGVKRALIATFIFGLLSSLRLVEGNLALTEIFMVLPISLAMLIAVVRKFDILSLFGAGILIALASLYKQVGAFEAAALGIYLFLISKNLLDFIKKGFFLSLGFAVPYLVTLGYFGSKGLIGNYIFGAYTYYRIYLGESPRFAIFINIAKYLPLVAAVGYGVWKKRMGQKIDLAYLFLLWAGASFLGSYFSGRTYGHYLVQAVPALSLLIARIDFRPKFGREQLIFGIIYLLPIIFLTRLLFSDFLSGGPINQIKYWNNFLAFATGNKSPEAYNNYFDSNVNTIMALSDYFSIHKAKGSSVYVWGDMSWLYAINDLKNPTRYVTSFHVFGVPGGKEEVISTLLARPPDYIIFGQSSIGYFSELEKLLVTRYTAVSKVETAQVYARIK